MRVKNTMRPADALARLRLSRRAMADGHDLRLDAAGGRADTAAERGDDQPLRQGATISGHASPRTQRGTVTGSARTFETRAPRASPSPTPRARVARRAGEPGPDLGRE